MEDAFNGRSLSASYTDLLRLQVLVVQRLVRIPTLPMDDPGVGTRSSADLDHPLAFDDRSAYRTLLSGRTSTPTSCSRSCFEHNVSLNFQPIAVEWCIM